MAVTSAPEIYDLITRKTNFKYIDSTIHLFLGGSAAHGAKLESKGDLDLFGVYVPPIETVVGMTPTDEHYVWSTSGDGVKNTVNDIDLSMYSIRKWAGMAASGNPTALEFLFTKNLAPKGQIWEDFIMPNVPLFLSSRTGFHFQKFCEHMLRTLKGEGIGKRGQRLDLIEEHGYDCYDEVETEFLTDGGWKRFDDVLDTDKVAAFDLATGAVKFETPLSRIDKQHSGLMYTVEPQLTRCVVTPNHAMAVSPASRGPKTGFSTKFDSSKADWQLQPLSEIEDGIKFRVTRSMYHIRRAAAPREDACAVASEYLALAGLYLSEGSINFRNGKVKTARLVQTPEGKDEYYKLADRLVRLLGGHRYDYPREHVEFETIWTLPRKVAEQLYTDFGHYKEKHLPTWCFHLSYDQSWELWNSACLGDGTRTHSDRNTGQGTVLYTSVKQLADDVQAMMVSSGHVCVVNGPYLYDKEPTSFGNTPMYQVYRPDDQNPYRCVNFKGGILKAGEEPKDKYGYQIKKVVVDNRRVVCFEMPSGTLVTRSNGKPAFQGNCKAAMHLIRVLNEGIELMTDGKITLPRPERQFLIDIRLGKAGTLDDIETLALDRFATLENARVNSSLPPEVNREGITKIITLLQQHMWNPNNEVLQIMGKSFSVATWWIADHCGKCELAKRPEWKDQNVVNRDMIAVAQELYTNEKKEKLSALGSKE